MDVTTRLDELRELMDGWLDGQGFALAHAGLNWLAAGFDRHFPDALTLPHLYPTAEGGIQAEWSLSPQEISLEIDLSTHQGEWHCLDLTSDTVDIRTLNLDTDGGWVWLVEELRRLAGGAV
jgi:hypothetical protein